MCLFHPLLAFLTNLSALNIELIKCVDLIASALLYTYCVLMALTIWPRIECLLLIRYVSRLTSCVLNLPQSRDICLTV